MPQIGGVSCTAMHEPCATQVGRAGWLSSRCSDRRFVLIFGEDPGRLVGKTASVANTEIHAQVSECV